MTDDLTPPPNLPTVDLGLRLEKEPPLTVDQALHTLSLACAGWMGEDANPAIMALREKGWTVTFVSTEEGFTITAKKPTSTRQLKRTNEMRLIVHDRARLLEELSSLIDQGIDQVILTPTNGSGEERLLTIRPRNGGFGFDVSATHLQPSAISGNPFIGTAELRTSLLQLDAPEVEFHFDGDRILKVQKTDGGMQMLFEVKF